MTGQRLEPVSEPPHRSYPDRPYPDRPYTDRLYPDGAVPLRAGPDGDGVRPPFPPGTPSGLVVVTDRRQARRELPELIRAAVDGGARWVLLRETDLPRDERLALAENLRGILAPAGGTLLVAGPDPLGGGAVHLPAAGPYPPPGLALVGRSCHDEAELGRLSTEDYVTLSPIFRARPNPGTAHRCTRSAWPGWSGVPRSRSSPSAASPNPTRSPPACGPARPGWR